MKPNLCANKKQSDMARNFFNSLVVVFVSMFVFSCTDEGFEDNRMPISQKPDTIVTGMRVVNGLTHNVDNQPETASDRMEASAEIQTFENGEVVNRVTINEYPTMDTYIDVTKPEYSIMEDQIEPEVTSFNVVRNADSKNVADGGIQTNDSVFISFSDGQFVKVPSMVTTFTGYYNGSETFTFGTVELKSAKLVSVENISSNAARTRATYVARTLRTKYTVEMEYQEVNTSKDTTYTVTLEGYATRNVLAEDEIESVVAENKNRVVIDDNTEKVSFEEVITMKSGEVLRNEKSIVLNREFKGIEAYDKFVSNFSFALQNSNGLSNGNETMVKNAENWTVYGRTDAYSANISNGVSADAFNTAYSLYHERATYADAHLTVEFGYESIDVLEMTNQTANATSDKSGYDKAVYTNSIRTSYIGYIQNLSEYVNLYKQARAISGYEFRNGTLVVNNNNVVTRVEFVTLYNDGTETTEKLSKSFSRSLVCTTNWSSLEDNADQYTYLVNAKLNGEDAKSENGWNWVNQNRTISSTAHLAASEQLNSWTAIDPNKISVTYKGQTYQFDEIEFNFISKNADVVVVSDAEEATVYSYNNTIAVSFGNNTVESTAPGTITVAKEIKGDFPAEWGKFVSAVSTVSLTEAQNDWTYTWSLHFENGTLPVVVGKNASNAVIDQSLFEYDTNDKLNGAVFKNGRWINSIASDEKNYMLWSTTQHVAAKALVYATATTMGWNNGNNTVFTSDFSFNVENGGKTLTVKKNGKVFASYRASSK